MGHSLHGSPPQQPPGCLLGPITFSIIRRRNSKSRTSYRLQKAAPYSHSTPRQTTLAAPWRSRKPLKPRRGCKWPPARRRSSISTATGLTSAEQVFRTASCRGARCGCPHMDRGRFVRLVGRLGSCGNTPTGASAPMRYRCRGLVDATAADSPAPLPNSPRGGKPPTYNGPHFPHLSLEPLGEVALRTKEQRSCTKSAEGGQGTSAWYRRWGWAPRCSLRYWSWPAAAARVRPRANVPNQSPTMRRP